MRKVKRFYHLTRLDPERPIEWPFAYEIVHPAPWPAKNWRQRKAMARPFSVLGALLRSAAGALDHLGALVEGQPYVQQYWQDGWHRSLDNRLGPYAYIGDVTPAIRAMYRQHPERFAACAPQLVAELSREVAG